MTIKAKEVLKDKFWIVEENGNKVGTLSATEECYTFSCSTGVEVFSTFNQLKKNLITYGFTKPSNSCQICVVQKDLTSFNKISDINNNSRFK